MAEKENEKVTDEGLTFKTKDDLIKIITSMRDDLDRVSKDQEDMRNSIDGKKDGDISDSDGDRKEKDVKEDEDEDLDDIANLFDAS